MGEEYVEFVRTATYESGIAGLLSPEAEAEFVERELLVNPRRGVVMRGTCGFRKLRVPLEGRGKRGGGRVVYYYVARRDRVFLVAFFPKNVKPNLTAAERAALRRLARELEQSE